MTTSRAKAVGSSAEREVANILGGERVGMDGGPTDVVVPGYANIQVKKVASLPSLNELHKWLDAMPQDALRGVVVIHRAGQGKRGLRMIAFDLDEYARWHGR